MKRLGFVTMVMLVVFSVSAQALETPLLATRTKFYKESEEIKPLLTKSKNIILMNSLFDSCIITVSQLDAYFHMVGIFNAIKEGREQAEGVDYLIRWLNEIKRTNTNNIESLGKMTADSDPVAKAHVNKLVGYFEEFNKLIDQEFVKLKGLGNWAKK